MAETRRLVAAARHVMWSGTRLVAARGLAAGASSRALSLQELAAALHDLPHHEPHLPHHDPEPPADTCVSTRAAPYIPVMLCYFIFIVQFS